MNEINIIFQIIRLNEKKSEKHDYLNRFKIRDETISYKNLYKIHVRVWDTYRLMTHYIEWVKNPMRFTGGKYVTSSPVVYAQSLLTNSAAVSKQQRNPEFCFRVVVNRIQIR